MLSAPPKRVSVLNELLCVDRELRRAADGGDMPALRRALKQGAEVDAVDCSGFTAEITSLEGYCPHLVATITNKRLLRVQQESCTVGQVMQ